MGDMLPDNDGFDIDHVIRNASTIEKVSLLAGRDFWHTVPLPRFNVTSVRVTDGPSGARGTKSFGGVRAACLPCGTGLAAARDQSLLYEAGVLIGKECKAKGASGWLGLLSYIKGAQSTGVLSIIKHFLANHQEHERISVDVRVSEQAFREIHLLPFHLAIADAAPGGIMTCYNKVNGRHVSENRDILEGIVLQEWGWKGLIMSDWYRTYTTADTLNAGLDLEMPGPPRHRGYLVELALSSRKVSRSTLDERHSRLSWDRILNRKLAADSVVLLKNESGLLPLNQKSIQSIALIGPNMKTAVFCGGGSASINPYYSVSPYQGIVDRLPNGVEVMHEAGTNLNAWIPELQQSDVRTPDGLPGLRMRFFREPPSIDNRLVIDEVIMKESSWKLLGFANPQLERLCYADIEAELIAPTTGPFEFGVAVYGSANLLLNDGLVIDNTSTQRGGTFFFGKGTLEEKAIVNLAEGELYRVKVQLASGPSRKLIKPGVANFSGGAGRLGMMQVVDPELAISRAVEAAKRADVTILCGELTSDYESEGFDRQHMDIPSGVPSLITAVLAAAPDTILIIQSGTPFNMLPWADHTKTHLHAWFGGNELGNGIADVLFGAVNPSGKLSLSFTRRVEDTPTYLNFGSGRGQVVYGEGIFVGYRYYEKVLRNVLYPFG
ncbi:hypothetical protein ACJ41O_012087 [Fusarium nematophilum]